MNIVEEKNNIDYNDDQKLLLNIFRFDKEEIHIKGSSNIKNIKIYADYDFYSRIKRKFNIDEIYNEFYKILSNILDNNDLYFIEFKIENNKKKIRFYYDEDFSFKKFSENFKNIKFCKIDIVIYSEKEHRFIDSSCIYDFSNKKIISEDYEDIINDEIKNLKKDKNYFKILKRLYLLFKLKKNNNKIEILNKIFNSDLADLYKNINNITVIETVNKYYNDALTKKRIEHNLLEINYPINFNEQFKSDKKKLNTESKKIYDYII